MNTISPRSSIRAKSRRQGARAGFCHNLAQEKRSFGELRGVPARRFDAPPPSASFEAPPRCAMIGPEHYLLAQIAITTLLGVFIWTLVVFAKNPDFLDA